MSDRVVINTLEKERLKALENYFILDTAAEKEFDQLAQLAAIVCDVPLAAISIIDENRQWFKSKIGFDIDFIKRDISYCNYTIQGKEIFEIENAKSDKRFRNYSTVSGKNPYIFYAGFPLIDPDGYALGTLCVLDYIPKKLNDKQKFALSTIAGEIVSHIVSRKYRFDKFGFEELFIRSIDLVCAANINGYFVKVNPAFSIVLGWSNKELTEKPFIEFIHPDDRIDTIEQMSKLSKGLRVINFKNRYRTKSGDYKVLSWTVNPDLAKGILYAIARDETEIVASKEKLIYAEKKFSDLFDNSPDAIFVEDSNGTILDLNTAAVLLQGIPKNELLGTNIKKLIPKERYVKLLRAYKSLYFGITKTIESTLWSKSNGEVPIEVSGKKIIYDSKPALLLIVRDISERKRMERERAEALIEKEKQREEQIKISLKVQEEERNRIAAEMHDDIGAGLGRISVLGNVIKKSFNDPNAVSINIEKILLSSQQVQKSISEIIWAMNTKNDSLNNLISYVNAYTLEFFETSSIKGKIFLPEIIPSLSINGKARRNIYLIIKEALNNIVKYAEATNAILNIKIEEGVFSIFISDNGKGFEFKNISRFSNGIQNMKKRISDLGGIINIDSGKASGTNIFLYIPVSAIIKN
jgi:PAS domain S-box-containing protein